MTTDLAARRDAARVLVESLQARHVARLEAAAAALGHPVAFTPVSWLRDEGRHGGGTRFQAGDTAVFDRASVNVSVVHYDDQPDKKLASATALSAIVHPRNPHAPSLHLHVSWTATKDGRGYWRVMADLNPALPDAAQTARFRAVLAERAGDRFAEGAAQGDRYFAIPALGRTRGVAHFYLEAFDSGDFEADRGSSTCTGRWSRRPSAPTRRRATPTGPRSSPTTRSTSSRC
jgi:coproporphyrinogen III oxidase